MDDLIALAIEFLIPMLIHWRVVIATVVALLVAVPLAATFAPFTGLFGIATVLCGVGAGLLWEMEAARSKRRAVTESQPEG